MRRDLFSRSIERTRFIVEMSPKSRDKFSHSIDRMEHVENERCQPGHDIASDWIALWTSWEECWRSCWRVL